MRSVQREFSILNRFNFERAPVGIKYLLNKPDAIELLDKKLDFCEMLKEAQGRSPFYVTQENIGCLGPIVLGMAEPDVIWLSGQMGPPAGLYKEARANQRVYRNIPTLTKGTVRYVVYSSLDEITFDPDVLIITANPSQAETLFRAVSYTTGETLSSKITPIVMCAWLYIYPYLSGELNYTITGLSSGMKSRQVLPEGLILISIPYNLIPNILENLQEMQWVLEDYIISREEHIDRANKLHEELMQEYLND
jgi:uncharacterized protein (DUF169 family)